MTTITNQARNSSILSNQPNSGAVIYLVSDALDYYLIGLSSDETLVTQDAPQLTNEIKH